MVHDIIESYLAGFLLPLPFFFVLYLARSLKKYFTDAANITMD